MEFTAVAEIVASHTYEHRAGGGVKFELQTLDSSPRKLEYGICLANPDPEVVRRGNAKMANLVLACRLTQITNSEQLHNRMLVVSYARNGYVTRVMAVAKPRELMPMLTLDARPAPGSRFRRWWQRLTN